MMQELSVFLVDFLKFLAGGVGVWGVTELVKRAPFIPIDEGQRARIRATSAALSALAVIGLGFVDKTLKVDDLTSAGIALVGAFIAWGGSHGTHRVAGWVRALTQK